LTVERSDRGGVHHDTAFAVLGVVLGHGGSRQPENVERPHQIDRDDLLKDPEIVRCAVFTDRSHRHADASATDRGAKRAHRRRLVDRSLNFLGIAHISPCKRRGVAKLFRELLPAVAVEVDDDHAPPLAHQLANRRLAQPRSSTRD
jgi:hypothetical protein